MNAYLGIDIGSISQKALLLMIIIILSQAAIFGQKEIL